PVHDEAAAGRQAVTASAPGRGHARRPGGARVQRRRRGRALEGGGWLVGRRAEESTTEFVQPLLDRAAVLAGHRAYVSRHRAGRTGPDPVEQFQPALDLPESPAAAQQLLRGTLPGQVSVVDLAR